MAFAIRKSVRVMFGAAVALALAVSAPVAAFANGSLIPNLWPSTDAELAPFDFAGFILGPDPNFSDELKLSGPGSAFLSDPDGISIGAKAGYDHQVGNLVLGILGDGYYSFADGGGVAGFESELNYYGTIRGRLGFATGRFMLYGTAGWAFGELEVTDNVAGLSDSQTLSGWVAGGGVEYVWNNDINLHFGYRRIDFGSDNYSSLPGGSQSLDAELDVFDFGIVSRF